MAQQSNDDAGTAEGAPTSATAGAEVSYMEIPGGRIAYEVSGDGPLVVLSHGIGDLRQSFRFLAPLLVAAGYRVACPDMRGHGDSSIGWSSISRSDVAEDLTALIRHLGAGPAVLVGQSLSGGAATIAAARSPQLVTAVVEINPFTRVPKTDLRAMMRVRRYRRGGLLMGGVIGLRSMRMWFRYLDVAYPTKPKDWIPYTGLLRGKLSRPGRMDQFLKTVATNGADAQAELPNVHCPTLIIMGSEDPDYPDPVAEGEAIVAALPAGVGTLEVIQGGGHYLHAECADEVAGLITDFVTQHVHA